MIVVRLSRAAPNAATIIAEIIASGYQLQTELHWLLLRSPLGTQLDHEGYTQSVAESPLPLGGG